MNWELIFWNALYTGVNAAAAGYCLISIGLNVHVGYTGLLNFGQAGFAAVGAYAFAIPIATYGWDWYFALPLVFVGSILLGLLLGLPTLRLRSDYLAIVTIAAAEIIRLVVRSVKFKEVFGGSDGINDFSGEFRRLGTDIGIQPAEQYGFWWFTFTGRQVWTMLIGWSLVALFGVLVYVLMKSPWGRVLKAIREDETAVRSLGKNVYSYKMQSLILGGVIGTFSGMIFALDRGSVQPDNYSRDVTFYVLTALVLGGVAKVSGSIVGPMLFWAVLAFTSAFLREAAGNDEQLSVFGWKLIENSSQIGQIRQMLIGLGLVLLMVFRPQGIFGNRKEMALDGR